MRSIWHFPLRKSYYLLHPIKLIKQMICNLHNAKMRLKFGFCDYDVWSMDAWFLKVVPPMLRKLADEGMAYPGVEPFETPEKWHSWLYSVADRLESCKEDKQNERNPYYKEYMDLIEEEIEKGNFLKQDDTLTLQRNKVCNKYFNKMREIEQESHLVLKECFAELAEHFWELWD